MKNLLITAAVATAIISTSALAADVGVSISIGQPGFYGQIDIGNFPQPQVTNVQPVIIEGRGMDRPPIYLHVPPEYAKHWKQHCHEYHACGERVFFVRDEWYSKEYVPRYQEQHREHKDIRHEDRKDEHKDVRREGDRHDDHHEEHKDDRR